MSRIPHSVLVHYNWINTLSGRMHFATHRCRGFGFDLILVWSLALARCRSLAIESVLQVILNLESKAGKARQKPGAPADYRRKGGHAFSASNPYGAKAAGDRQFVRT